MQQIEGIDGVAGVIIGRSYGGKSLGAGSRTGAIKIQRKVSGGIKAVTQTEKGLQELFIRTGEGMEDTIIQKILTMLPSTSQNRKDTTVLRPNEIGDVDGI
jgi:hypothetical protein